MNPPPLKLDWCSHQAALYAAEHWHYSRCLPAGKTVKVGVWEGGVFIGAVIFSWGVLGDRLGQQFGLAMDECCELTRVALNNHVTPVSRILSIALRMLRKQSPGMKAVISYADCDQDHHGGIYAAGGWIYLGKVQLNGGTPKWRLFGKDVHGRTVGSRYGRGSQNLDWLRANVDPHAEKVFTTGKHKYIMPFDAAVKCQAQALARPYPKRAGSIDPTMRPAIQREEGGSIPTPALQPHNRSQTTADADASIASVGSLGS